MRQVWICAAIVAAAWAVSPRVALTGYYDCADCAATYDCIYEAQLDLASGMQSKENEIDAKQDEIAAKNAEISNAMAAGEDPTPLLLQRKALEVELDQLNTDWDLLDAKMSGLDIASGCCS